MKKPILRFSKWFCFGMILWVGVPLHSEIIDMNKIPEQYGMKDADKGVAWTDDPSKYAAAQQISQTEVNKFSLTNLMLILVVAGGAGWLVLKLRRL